jgi:hypothetical protein
LLQFSGLSLYQTTSNVTRLRKLAVPFQHQLLACYSL